jgi:hypothetical protein
MTATLVIYFALQGQEAERAREDRRG